MNRMESRGDGYIVVRYHPQDFPRVISDPLVTCEPASGAGDGPEHNGILYKRLGLVLEFVDDVVPGYEFPPPRGDMARAVMVVR